jgi:hypothetical protein
MSGRRPRRIAPLRRIGLLPCLGLLLWAGPSAPVWARGNDCVFRTGTALVLGFGVLDPSAARRVQQQATAARGEDLQAGDCAPGVQMRIQIEGGQHDAGGQLRMRHATRPDTFLRYTVQVTPVLQRGPGNQRYVGFELLGQLEAADIAVARGGTYQDTLRISVLP